MTRLFDDQRIEEFQAVALPSPHKTRWQPIRGGLLNLYLYDSEEFRYENGHLLLRGNNGTGKSRIMALQLPFLLDGQLHSSRVEPDADQSKKMAWNLLMGKHNERTGYTWLEFGKLSEPSNNGRAAVSPEKTNNSNGDGFDINSFQDQHEEFITIGCGLSATKGSGMRDPWFFVTNQRIGRDLFLQSESGHPISKSALGDAIGDHGEVFKTAKEYRAEIDDRLFGLGQRRYEAMVELLIQLRKPQLSRELDDKMLARVLGEALPPPSESMIKDVAESFKGLESERIQLDRFRQTREGVDEFLKVYRRYAQVASRRRGQEVRSRNSQYELAQKKLKEAQQEFNDAEEAFQLASTRVDSLEIERGKLSAKLKALQSDPAMKGAQAITDAQSSLDQAKTNLSSTQGDLDAAEKRVAECRQQLESTKEQFESQANKTKNIAGSARKTSKECDLANAHQTAFQYFDWTVSSKIETRELANLKSTFEKQVQSKNRAADKVELRNEELKSANAELAGKQEQLDRADVAVDEAIHLEKTAESERTQSVVDYLDSVLMWSKESELLVLPELDSLHDAAQQWSQSSDETSNPIVDLVENAKSVCQKHLISEAGKLDLQRSSLRTNLNELVERKHQLEIGEQIEPTLPESVSESSRQQRLGAPFWQLVDFRSNCAAEDRANLEAALQAAGILTAWVTADGDLLNSDTHEVILVSSERGTLPTNKQLSQVMSPISDDQMLSRLNLKREIIETILGTIGLGKESGDTWVCSTGHWKNGIVEGRWTKQHAEFIGSEARDANRLRVVNQLESDIEQVNRQLSEIDAAYSTIQRQQSDLESHLQKLPSDSYVRQSVAKLHLAASETVARRNEHLEIGKSVVLLRQAADAVREQRDTDARDLGMLLWVDRLGDLKESLAKYERELSEFWPTCEHFLHLLKALGEAELRHKSEELQLELLNDRLHRRKTEWESAQQRLKTLRQSVGKDADKILAEIDATSHDLQTVSEKLETAESERQESDKQKVRLDERINAEKKSVDEETAERLVACESFQRLVSLGILKTASRKFDDTDAVAWSISRTVEVARKTEAKFSKRKSDPSAWDRARQNVTESNQELATALSQHSFVPTLSTQDGLYVVTVPYEGRDHSVSELYEFLDNEVSQRQLILDENERKIIENHLIGEVASKLNEQIQDAHQLVDQMNVEIQRRPMSTGMTLKFDWKPDDELSGGIVEMCERLLGKSTGWSAAERESIGRFLQSHIQEVRTAREKGTWLEHLREALDYRRWHRFWVMRKQDGGAWKRLTKKTHGTGSGGEKAVALTIPQFAAASAHYQSARSDAPRLILLDEAFVGIDPDMRGKCMELIDVFDLDFLMTSESEWGCYATLPGVGIYQLSTRRGFDAVFLTRWIWNGKGKVRDDRVIPSAAPRNPR
ncbi:MAG: TIGR02680 family protein [Pirellulaceae bacterium]